MLDTPVDGIGMMPNEFKYPLGVLTIPPAPKKLQRAVPKPAWTPLWAMSGVVLASCSSVSDAIQDAQQGIGGGESRPDPDPDPGVSFANYADLNNRVTEDSQDRFAGGLVVQADADDRRDTSAWHYFVLTDEGDGDPDDPDDSGNNGAELDIDGTLDARGQYGEFSVMRNGAGEVIWIYTLDNADRDTNNLPGSSTAIDRLKVRVYDADGMPAEAETAIVNISGANDRPTTTGAIITITDSNTPGGASESPTGGLAGTFIVTDDTDDTHSFAVSGAEPREPQNSHEEGFDHRAIGTYGWLHFNSANGDYQYFLNHDAISTIPADGNDADTFTFTATDNSGLRSESAQLVFNIVGANESPVAWVNDDPNSRLITLARPEDNGARPTDTAATFTLRFDDSDNPAGEQTVRVYEGVQGEYDPSSGTDISLTAQSMMPGDYGTFHFSPRPGSGSILVWYVVADSHPGFATLGPSSTPLRDTVTFFIHDGTDASRPVTFNADVTGVNIDTDRHGAHIHENTNASGTINWPGESDWFLTRPNINFKYKIASYHLRLVDHDPASGDVARVSIGLQEFEGQRDFWIREEVTDDTQLDRRVSYTAELGSGGTNQLLLVVEGVGNHVGTYTVRWSLSDPCDGFPIEGCTTSLDPILPIVHNSQELTHDAGGGFEVHEGLGSSGGRFEFSEPESLADENPYSITDGPQYGSFAIDADGRWGYQPDTDIPGLDSGGVRDDHVGVAISYGKGILFQRVDFTVHGRTNLRADDPDVANVIEGTAAAELIQGGHGDDTIFTRPGEDLVIGGYGDDVITLCGGSETVIYRFESGPDTWTATDGSDVINVFTRGADKLVLVDTAESRPVTDLAGFKASPNRPVVRIIDGGEGGSQITGMTITFSSDGVEHGSSGRVLTVNFNTAGPLLDVSEISTKLNGDTLTCFCVLDDLLGGEAFLQVTEEAALPLEVI